MVSVEKNDVYCQKVNGNLEVEKVLVEYEPLMRWILASFSNTGFEEDDFLQEARLLLLKALERYNPCRNVKFTTYYSKILKNYLFDHIRKSSAKKRIPKSCLIQQNFWNETDVYQTYNYRDTYALIPESHILIKEELSEYLQSLSTFERETLIRYLTNYNVTSADKIEEQKQLYAYYRCRRKMVKYLK